MNTSPSPGVELQLPITGMSCGSCAARVEKALRAVPGVRQASVTLATEPAAVEADAGTPLDALGRALQRAGYGLALRETTLEVQDMTCATCVGRVERALRPLIASVGGEVAGRAGRRHAFQTVGWIEARNGPQFVQITFSLFWLICINPVWRDGATFS